MTETNIRQRYTAVFLTVVMVIGMIAMGAFVAMPAAAEVEGTPGADIPAYESPDPNDYDLAVYQTLNDISPYDFDDTEDAFDNFEDAIANLSAENTSIIVFNGTYGAVEFNAGDGQVVEVAAYHGPAEVEIDGEVTATTDAPDSLTLRGMTLNGSTAIDATNIDSLTVDHSELPEGGISNADDVTILNTLVDADTPTLVAGDTVTAENSVFNGTGTGIVAENIDVSSSNFTTGGVGINADGADGSLDVDLSHFNVSGTMGIHVGASFEGDVSVTNSEFLSAGDIGVQVDNAAFVTVENIEADGINQAVLLNDWDETATVTGVTASDVADVLTVSGASGLELVVSDFSADGGGVSVDAASDIRYVSVSDGDLTEGSVSIDGVEGDALSQLSIDSVVVDQGSIDVALPTQRVNSVSVTDVAVNGSSTNGLSILGSPTTVRGSFVLDNVSATNNAQDGISIDTVVMSSLNEDGLVMQDIDVEGNGDNGIGLHAGIDAHTIHLEDVHAGDNSVGILYAANLDAEAAVSMAEVNASANTNQGIHLTGDAEAVQISDSTLSDNENGLAFGGASAIDTVEISASDIADNTLGGIAADAGGPTNVLTISDNTFDDNGQGILYDTAGIDLTVTDNDFTGDGAVAIQMLGAAPSEWVLANNQFLDTDGVALDLDNAFVLDDEDHDITANFWGHDSGPAISSTNAGDWDIFYALGAEIVLNDNEEIEDPEDITPWLDADGNEVIAFYGHLFEPDGSTAIAGAEVTFEFEHYATEETGSYTFDETGPAGEFVAVVDRDGGHNAIAHSPGYAASDSVDFTISQQVAVYLQGGVDFTMNEGGFLEAAVVAPDNATLTDADPTEFSLIDASDGTVLDSGLTVHENADGDYVINASVTPGEYDVYLHAPGEEANFPNSTVHTYDLGAGGETVAGDDFQMGGQLNMTVLDPEGVAYNETVDLIDAETDEMLADWTEMLDLDENGTAVVNLSVGDYSAYVDNESFTPSDAAAFSILGGADEMTNVTFTLKELDTAELTITVVDADGDALAGETVTVSLIDTPPFMADYPKEVELDADGQATILIPADDRPTSYTVRVAHPEFGADERGVAPEISDDIDRTFELDVANLEAEFVILDAYVDETMVDVGDTAVFTVDLMNTDWGVGTTTVQLDFGDGLIVESEELTLEGGEAGTVTFEVVMDVDAAAYTWWITESHSEGAFEGYLTVVDDEPPVTPTPTPPDTPTPTPTPPVDTPTPTPVDDDAVPGFGVTIALMALLGAALLAYRRYQG